MSKSVKKGMKENIHDLINYSDVKVVNFILKEIENVK